MFYNGIRLLLLTSDIVLEESMMQVSFGLTTNYYNVIVKFFFKVIKPVGLGNKYKNSDTLKKD